MKNHNPTYKKLFTTFLVFTIFSSSQSIAQLDLTYEEQFDIGGDTNRSHTQRSETADINADGWPDIFDANSNNIPNNTNNIIRFNNQNASFNAEPVLEGPENVNSRDMGLVDFNRDGYPDLIRLESFVNSDIAQVFIYRNLHGSGSDGFGRNWFNLNSPSASTNENCANYIDFGDLNNDGWTDFIVAHQGNDCGLDGIARPGISIYLNTSSENSNGDISFEFSTQIQASNRSTRFNSAIIVKGNGDNFPDIVAFNPTNLNIATDFYINSGGQSLSFTEHPGGEDLGISNSVGAVADFNLDGVDDIVTFDLANRTINIFIQRVVPSRFTPFKGFAIADHIIINSPEIRLVHDIEIGDFDLNGIPDIFISGTIADSPDTQLFVAELSRSRTVSFNKVATSLLPNQDIRHPYGTGNAIDYDLDGDLDIYISGAGFGTRFETLCSTIFCFPNRFYENKIPLVMNGSENTSYDNFENPFNSSWSQGSTDTHNWTVTNGATPSFNTGPSRAKSGNNYLYLETSAGGGANARGNTAFFISPVIQSINISQVLSFDYHMFGSNIGSLHIDLIKPVSSTSSLPGEVLVEDIFVLEGAQQSDSIDAWKTATVNLRPSLSASFSAFETPRYMIRIRAVAAAGFRGDIALDNLIIKTNPQAISEQID